MYKRAIILAGGKGTRLKPYTIALPKPLVPIGETPILEIIIKQLISHGFKHITLTVNHMAEIIQAFFGNGSKWGIKIDYSREEKPLSTMGPLELIEDLPDDFLIMNGDVLTDLNYSNLMKYHVEHGNIFTVSSFVRKQKSDYGVLELNEQNYLKDFKEKPIAKFNVSMGIYIANKRILEYIPYNKFYGFDQLMKDLIKNNNPAQIFKHNGYWLDIGRPEDYEKACNDIDRLNLK